MKKQIQFIIETGKAKNCSEEDMQEMLAAFHQPEREFELKDILLEDIFTENEESYLLPEFKLLYKKLWKRIEHNQKRNKLNNYNFTKIIKIAAAIIFGLFIGTYTIYLKNNLSEPKFCETHSPKGSVSETILPDGTVVFLNADSQIKYSIDRKNEIREVFLEGEAWFSVNKIKNNPFIVHTSFYDVNVTGTKFNIKAYKADNDITTTLEEGQIIIKSTDNCKLIKDVILKPGEQVILNKKTRQLSIKEVNPRWFTSWKDDILIFVNINLKDLIILLERKYGVTFDVKDESILDFHFDGTIKNESIIEFLNIVKETLPINYKIIGQKIEITYNKN